MAQNYGYITFYRSKGQFLFVFLGFIVAGGLVFGLAHDFARSFLLILLSIGLIISFLYEFYLTASPIVEAIDDSMTLKQMYHPIFKWRVVYWTHIIGFDKIMLMQVKLDKKNSPSLLQIQYRGGAGINTAYLRRSDVVDFKSVIALIEDKLPNLTINYIKS